MQTRFRDARTLHLEADRRKPFAFVDARAPEPTKLSANRSAAALLVGLASGVLITLACAGQPW